MIIRVLCLVICNIAVLLATGIVAARLQTGKPLVDVVVFMIVRLAIISALVLSTGLIGILSAEGIGLVCLAGAAILLVRRPGLPRAGFGLEDFNQPVVWFSAVVLGRLVLQAWFFAPYHEDVLSYHLPKVAEWVQSERFTREMGTDTHSTFPAGFELVETWWVVFLHHDILIEVAGIEFLALAFAATRAIAAECGLSGPHAWLAGLVYILCPTFYFQATSCMNDGAVAALILATTSLVLVRVPYPLVLLAVGLGMGTKATYVYAATGLIVLALRVRALPVTRSSSWTWLLGSLGVSIGLFWYGRNLLAYGNPIYPIGAGGLMGEEISRWIQVGPSLASLRQNIIAFIVGFAAERFRSYDATAEGMNGWGPLILVGGLPGLVMLLRASGPARGLVLALSVSTGIVLMSVKPDPWAMRFILFLPVLPAIGVAFLARAARWTVPVIGALMIANVMVTMTPKQIPQGQLAALADQGWRTRTFADLIPPEVRCDAIGCFTKNFGTPYLLYRPDYSRRVAYLRPVSAEDLIDQMRKAQVQVLYAIPASAREERVLEEAVAGGQLRRFQSHLYLLR